MHSTLRIYLIVLVAIAVASCSQPLTQQERWIQEIGYDLIEESANCGDSDLMLNHPYLTNSITDVCEVFAKHEISAKNPTIHGRIGGHPEGMLGPKEMYYHLEIAYDNKKIYLDFEYDKLLTKFMCVQAHYPFDSDK
jgi:hypothetical protein